MDPEPPFEPSAPRRSTPATLRLAADWAWRLLLVTAAGAVVVWALIQVKLVVVPIFVALLLASVIAPPTRWLERKGVRTALATAISFFGFLLAVVGVALLMVPAVSGEFEDLGPTIEQAVDDVEEWFVEGPLELDADRVRDYREQLEARIERLWSDASLTSDDVVAGVRTAGEIMAGIFLALVLTFFIVKDARLIQRWVLDHVPVDQRDLARAAAQRAWLALGAFLRGAALLGLVEAVVIGLAVWIAGGALVAPVMVFTFAAAFFPIVGAIVAGVIAVLVTLTTAGFTPALIVAIIVLVVQQLDNDVLAPFIYGRFMRLHPAVILVVLSAGGVLGGILGAFLAVPVTAVVVAVAGEVYQRRTAGDPRWQPEPRE